MNDALADTVMRELRRYLEKPLFIAQTGKETSGRWASDAWIPGDVAIAPDSTDENDWQRLEKPEGSEKSIGDHVRLQFSIEEGKPSFSVSQIEAGKIRVSAAIELPGNDPSQLCRAVATAKRACANWSRHLLAAGDAETQELENLISMFHRVKDFASRMADWLCSTYPEAAMPHPDNATQTPAPP